MNFAIKNVPVSSRLTGVDKRTNISQRELIKEYVEPGLPVILTDAARAWPAMGRITPAYLKTHYGHVSHAVKGTTYTMAEYVDLMLASTPANPAPYPFNLNLQRVMQELLTDLQPDILYGKSDRVKNPLVKTLLRNTTPFELFLGGNGASFPYLHIDALYFHTQITQLYGAKEFILYSPDQRPYMYPRADNAKVSQVEVNNPDYEKFPLFRQAQPLVFTVEEGETLLFPTGWWHTTRIHEPCISFGRSHLNASNWPAFTDDYSASHKAHHPVLAVAARYYAKAVGKVFDWQEQGKG